MWSHPQHCLLSSDLATLTMIHSNFQTCLPFSVIFFRYNTDRDFDALSSKSSDFEPFSHPDFIRVLSLSAHTHHDYRVIHLTTHHDYRVIHCSHMISNMYMISNIQTWQDEGIQQLCDMQREKTEAYSLKHKEVFPKCDTTSEFDPPGWAKEWLPPIKNLPNEHWARWMLCLFT